MNIVSRLSASGLSRMLLPSTLIVVLLTQVGYCTSVVLIIMLWS